MMKNTVRMGMLIAIVLSGAIEVTAQQGRLMREEQLVSFSQDGIATVEVTWHMRPPFYRGAVPFTYVAGVRNYGVQFGTRSMAWMDFGDFKVTFQTDPSFTVLIPGIARATGRNGRVLVEARARRLVKGSGFEVRETHYGPEGRVAFECDSFFTFQGVKIEEHSTQGRKSQEYFFIWSSDH